GGDISKSKIHFEKSLKIAPNYLGTYVLFARLHDVKKDDEVNFKKRLNRVLKAKASTLKAARAENVIEQRKAQKFLTDMEDIF
ncbi:MAG: hypothetical protein ACI9QD_000173, partial [Thermoproteota archaeon]